MVVEDNDPLRAMVARMLTSVDYEVREACDGEEALALLGEWRPDAIVLDLMMPWMDGLAFRQRQRARPELADIPIVVLTAAPQMVESEPGFEANEVIRKPFRQDHLLTAVRRCIPT